MCWLMIDDLERGRPLHQGLEFQKHLVAPLLRGPDDVVDDQPRSEQCLIIGHRILVQVSLRIANKDDLQVLIPLDPDRRAVV